MDNSFEANSIEGGNSSSFEYILRNYEKMIYTFIYHMVHNADNAQDLTQDVFIRVYKNLYKYKNDYPLKPWLYKIAYNTTISYIKKNKYVLRDDLPEVLTLNIDCISEFETKYVVLKEIQSFEPECRAIFILRFIENLSFDQIAIMLGKTTASVKMKFYKNRKILIDKLTKLYKEE